MQHQHHPRNDFPAASGAIEWVRLLEHLYLIWFVFKEKLQYTGAISNSLCSFPGFYETLGKCESSGSELSCICIQLNTPNVWRWSSNFNFRTHHAFVKKIWDSEFTQRDSLNGCSSNEEWERYVKNCGDHSRNKINLSIISIVCAVKIEIE
jgi:hypothetical protein